MAGVRGRETGMTPRPHGADAVRFMRLPFTGKISSAGAVAGGGSVGGCFAGDTGTTGAVEGASLAGKGAGPSNCSRKRSKYATRSLYPSSSSTMPPSGWLPNSGDDRGLFAAAGCALAAFRRPEGHQSTFYSSPSPLMPKIVVILHTTASVEPGGRRACRIPLPPCLQKRMTTLTPKKAH